MKQVFLLGAMLWLFSGCAPQATDVDTSQPPSSDAQANYPNDKLSAADECMSEPETDMMCNQQYQPVCGCNEKTYGNACMAKIAGVQRWADGPCGGPHPNE